MLTETEPGEAKLPRVLGPTAAFCVVVGSVIGSGIFIVPTRVAGNVPFVGGIAFVWIVGGLFSMAGALTLAELAAMLPSAGGPYVYLREAFGRLPAFLFGWTEFLVIRTGSIATLAAAFGLNFALLVKAPAGMHPVAWQTTAAVVAITFLAVINVIGTRLGGWVQVVGTVLKIGALMMMILPFVKAKVDVGLLTPVMPASMNSGVFSGIMVAMISVLWAYDGWVNAASLAEEIQDPGRNIPRTLILGLLTLIGLYLGMTLIYHLVIPLPEVMNPPVDNGVPRIVSVNFLQHLIGDKGRVIIALVIMTSVFITLNANALSGPRAYFAMARDGLFPKALCKVDPNHQTPANAIIAQTAWAVLLMIAASAFLLIKPPTAGLPAPMMTAWEELHKTPLYDVLSAYVVFGGTIFYGLAIVSVFVLRAKRPDLPRPYKTWGYPMTPLLYSASSLLLLGSMLYQRPFESLTGLSIVAAGVPAYLIFSRGSSSHRAI